VVVALAVGTVSGLGPAGVMDAIWCALPQAAQAITDAVRRANPNFIRIFSVK
jgi:hypothetical protein